MTRLPKCGNNRFVKEVLRGKPDMGWLMEHDPAGDRYHLGGCVIRHEWEWGCDLCQHYFDLEDQVTDK